VGNVGIRDGGGALDLKLYLRLHASSNYSSSFFASSQASAVAAGGQGGAAWGLGLVVEEQPGAWGWWSRRSSLGLLDL